MELRNIFKHKPMPGCIAATVKSTDYILSFYKVLYILQGCRREVNPSLSRMVKENRMLIVSKCCLLVR